MPGPGPHLVYSLTVGTGLMHISKGGFSPHHCLVYAVNAFLGPDIGPFLQWLVSNVGLGKALGSLVMDFVHHPFYYALLLGFPLSILYSWLSKMGLQRGWLDSASGVHLSRKDCLLLVSAGSLSHFFLDHLFEENGHSPMYTWIMSTGWDGRIPNDMTAVSVVGILCIALLVGFAYVNRPTSAKSHGAQSKSSLKIIAVIILLYLLWCSSQIYWRYPPQPAVGEEPDLGIMVFLVVYFFLPHGLCIASMHDKDNPDTDDMLQL